MGLPSNCQAAVNWIDEQLAKPNIYDFNLGNGVIVNDLHKCLTTKRERILEMSNYNQKIVFLHTKLIKDKLTNG
ncbi:hypothetical protein [Flavobacterium sp.]|jgi:hypothetical protein|uniref:hypothetical protein n=1 Tax=Flavobacterium sp. TaxID=239 RepID=UPI0037BFC96A